MVAYRQKTYRIIRTALKLLCLVVRSKGPFPTKLLIISKTIMCHRASMNHLLLETTVGKGRCLGSWEAKWLISFEGWNSKWDRQIQEESNRIIKRYETLNVGEAVYTSGGSLSCRYVIHTVGPEWYNHRKDISRFHLRQVCFHTLSLAVKLNLYFHCPPGHQLWYFRHAKRHLCWSHVFDNKRIQFEVRRQV